MKQIINPEFIPYILIVLIYVISAVIVNPIGNFTLNDDWAHGESVKIFLLCRNL